ncbi:MAG: Peptide-methionine (S)-S-oxide reductase MsrA, partial [uncultured Solirubrobacterales bacterium]
EHQRNDGRRRGERRRRLRAGDRGLRRRLLLGRGGDLRRRRGGDLDPRRLHRRNGRRPDLQAGLSRPDRSRRGGRGDLRPRRRLLRGSARGLLERSQPDDQEPPGAGHRQPVPLRHLLPRSGPGGRRDSLQGEARGRIRERDGLPPARQAEDRGDRDLAGRDVPRGRGLPPALLRAPRDRLRAL